jgi:exodeoxyribonuclease-3
LLQRWTRFIFSLSAMRIASWNVNSIKAHLRSVLSWLRREKPDVVLLQEIKTTDDAFPRLEVEDLGYNLAIVGQRSYNGVAILSKHPLSTELTALPGDGADDQARYVEGLVQAGRSVVRVASIYLPNGNPAGSDKFEFKLAWMDRLRAHVRELLPLEEMLVLGGDYNVAPTDADVYDPEGWRDDALCRPESRNKLRALLHLGLTDAVRVLHPEPRLYTFWDYQGGCWPRDEGLRIDHLLLSPQAADRLQTSGIDRAPRGDDKPSDHTPVWCELELS